MRIVEKDDVVYFKFKELDKYDFINHSVSSRYGGVSSKDGLQTMNLGTHTSDDIENVRQNYKIFCEAAGYDVNRIVLGNQSHSLNVRCATPKDCGKGVFSARDYTDVDALITDEKNLPLVIHSADCVPVSFIDTRLKVIGNAHCGWRGTFGELAKITLNEMIKRFSTHPEDVVCTIGPCICKSCYEVSMDLYIEFQKKFGDSDSLMNKDNSYYIDLAGVNRQILISCGVSSDNIFVSDICTCCNIDYLYSHRGQGTKRGIFASFLQLN